MATNKKIFEIEINGIKSSATDIKTLKETLKGLEEQFDSAEFGSERFNELASAISKVKTELKELGKATESVKEAVEEIEVVTSEQISDGFLKIGEAAAGAFGVISSGLIAIGADSEEMEKVQAKFEGVIAILNSTKMITEALSAENQKNIKFALATAEAYLVQGKAAQTAALAGQTGVKSLGQAFVSFGRVLLANPIFLIASIITTILAATGNLDDVFKAIGKTIGKVFEPLIPLFNEFGRILSSVVDPIVRSIGPSLEVLTLNFRLMFGLLKFLTPVLQKIGDLFEYFEKNFNKLTDGITYGINSLTDWIGITEDANQVQIDVNKTIELATEIQNKYRISIENSQKARQREIDLMRAQGASATALEKKELDLLETKRDAIKAEYDFAVAIIQRLKATGQLDKLTREQKEQFLTLQNELLDAQTAFDVKNAEVEQNRIKRNEEANKKIADDTKKRQEDALKALQDKLAKDNDLLQKEFVEKRIKLNEQRVDGTIQKEEELNEKLQALGQEQVVAELAAANKALDEIKKAKGLNTEQQLKLEEDQNKKILAIKEKLSEEDLAIFEAGEKKKAEEKKKSIEDRYKEIAVIELTEIGKLDRKKLEKEKTYETEVLKIQIEADKKRLDLLEKDSVEYLELLQKIKDAEEKIIGDANKKQDDDRLKRIELLQTAFQSAADSIGTINDIIQEQFAIQVEKTEQALDEVRGVISSIDEDISSRKEDLQGLQQEFAEARGQRAQDILDDLAREEAAISKLEKTRAIEIAKANKLEAEKAKLQERSAKIAAVASVAQAALATAVVFTPGFENISPVGVAARIAAGLALVAALFSSISQFKSMKFEDGGVVQGPSHAQGGVRGTGSFSNIEVEGGEFVVNKRSTAANMDLLRSINSSSGRFKFADGGIVGATGAMQSASQQLADQQTAAILQSMQALANRPSVVSVVDIANVSNKVTAIQNSSSL